MNPVAFSLFGLDIKWYGILIGTGMLLGIILAKYTTDIKNISYETFTDFLLIAIPAGIIGARLWYVIFEFENYRGNLQSIFNIREGGLAIHGGVIFGVLSALIYSRMKRVNIIKYLDAAAPSLILAQAIGRWGNFLNQEAHGGEVTKEFISRFPQFIQNGMLIGGKYYHPTFLYESLWNLTVCIILLLVINKSRRDGTTFFTYIGLYSIGRYFIEGLRTDSLMLADSRFAQIINSITGTTRTAQLISLAGVVIWIGYLVYAHLRNRRTSW